MQEFAAILLNNLASPVIERSRNERCCEKACNTVFRKNNYGWNTLRYSSVKAVNFTILQKVYGLTCK